NAIVQDLDQAISLLGEDTDRGLADKSTARALKSRVLLYAASDLYNRPGNTNALVGYTGCDRAARWTAAKNAAWEIIQSGRYELYQPHDRTAVNYAIMFLSKGQIATFPAKIYDNELMITSNPQCIRPCGYNFGRRNLPTQPTVEVHQQRGVST